MALEEDAQKKYIPWTVRKANERSFRTMKTRIKIMIQKTINGNVIEKTEVREFDDNWKNQRKKEREMNRKKNISVDKPNGMAKKII